MCTSNSSPTSEQEKEKFTKQPNGYSGEPRRNYVNNKWEKAINLLFPDE